MLGNSTINTHRFNGISSKLFGKDSLLSIYQEYCPELGIFYCNLLFINLFSFTAINLGYAGFGSLYSTERCIFSTTLLEM